MPEAAPHHAPRVAERVHLRGLPGGGRLAVVSNPLAPTFTIAGIVRAGPATADDGRSTVPSLTAALLDRGADGMSRLQLARALEDHGLQLTVGVSPSMPSAVSFVVQGLAEELGRGVGLLAAVLCRPTFPEDELDTVRAQVLGTLEHEATDASRRAFAELTRLVYRRQHPWYRRPIEVRRAEVCEVTRDDLLAHHRLAYRPSTLVCVVVGQVAVDEVADRLAEAFAGWPAGGVEHGPLPPAAPRAPDPWRLIPIPDRPACEVFMGHACDLRPGDRDHVAAVLANSCLGHSTLTSRLGVALRDEAGLSYGVSSSFLGTHGEPGPWLINLGVAAPDLHRAVELTMDVVRRYAAEGPGQEELDDERLAVSGAFKVGLATNTGMAAKLLEILAADLDVERLDRWPAEVLDVSRRRVLEALRRHIRPDDIVIAAAGTFDDVSPSR
jgi:zinc protease